MTDSHLAILRSLLSDVEDLVRRIERDDDKNRLARDATSYAADFEAINSKAARAWGASVRMRAIYDEGFAAGKAGAEPHSYPADYAGDGDERVNAWAEGYGDGGFARAQEVPR